MVYKVISAVIIVLLIVLNIRGCDKERSATNLLASLGDSLSTTRDKLGREVTKSNTLSIYNGKQLLLVKSQDSSIISLQEIIEDYRGQLRSASHLHTVTAGKVITNTIVQVDTVGNDIYPTYKGIFDTPWYKGTVIANKDKVTNVYKVINKYQIVEGKESNGWFKKKQYTSTVINLNPNTSTKEFKTVVITGIPKRFTFGMQIGYGLTLPELKPTMYIGGGINIHILGIK